MTELEDYRHEYLRLWMSGFFNDHKFTILNEWSQQWCQHPDALRDVVNNNSKLNNIDWVKGLHARISTIMSEWFLQWPQVYNFEWVESTMIPDSLRDVVHNNSKLNNIDWVRGLEARISTIMNEWFLQWPQVYYFEWVESTMMPASRRSKGCSKW